MHMHVIRFTEVYELMINDHDNVSDHLPLNLETGVEYDPIFPTENVTPGSGSESVERGWMRNCMT